MKILEAKHSGFCPGVRRAVDCVYRLLDECPDTVIVTLGELIHNPLVTSALAARGIRTVEDTEIPALLSEAEDAFLANENVNADNVCRTISQVEALENVCLAICEDCVAKYVCALETSLDGDTSENGMREIHVSALKKDFSDLVLRTEQYLKALTE